jgi:hypothetical protein
MSSQESQQQFSVTPQNSETPLISSDQRQVDISTDGAPSGEGAGEDRDLKTGKRKFFGLLGKKKDEQGQKDMASSSTGNMSPPPTLGSTMRSPSPGKASDLKPHPQPIPISPNRQSAFAAASPSRMRSSSPRLHSPASSEIFERSVQEPVQISTLQGELSPAHIPSHVITEDHIPPALEASANAITSEDLNPDEVEIVTSTSHQPAGSALESSASQADLTQLHTPMSPLHHVRSDESEQSGQQSGIMPPPGEEDGYGSLDPTDVRRLSFISFADVVQSEHQQPPTSALSEAGNRDSLHFASLPSSFKQDRAASPLRSPRSGGVRTPPPGVNVTAANMEQSPGRTSGLASPMSPSSELQIETMRQAVRKTASGDLGGGRSAGMSPVSDENLSSASRSRTNS